MSSGHRKSAVVTFQLKLEHLNPISEKLDLCIPISEKLVVVPIQLHQVHQLFVVPIPLFINTAT